MNTIKFFACTQCKRVTDLSSADLEYVQKQQHGYFWNGPASCFGSLTVESTQQEWEAQEGRLYDMGRITTAINKS